MKIDIDINEKYKELEILIKSNELDAKTLEVLNLLKERKAKNILGKQDKEIFLLNLHDIILFYSENQKVFSKTNNGVFEVDERLYEIEEKFRSNGFVRVSKFSIVNMNMVKSIDMSFSGNCSVNLSNGEKERISRSFISSIKNYLKEEW